MVGFYQRVLSGVPCAAALRRAEDELRQTHSIRVTEAPLSVEGLVYGRTDPVTLSTWVHAKLTFISGCA